MCFEAAILDFKAVQQLLFKPRKKQNYWLVNIKIDERINERYFARRREASNCTILTVSPLIYAIGEKEA